MIGIILIAGGQIALFFLVLYYVIKKAVADGMLLYDKKVNNPKLAPDSEVTEYDVNGNVTRRYTVDTKDIANQ